MILRLLRALRRWWRPVEIHNVHVYPGGLRLVSTRCVCCGKDCPALFPEDREKPTTQTSIHGGGTIEFGFGYGSRHDTDTLVGVICDGCAPQLAAGFEQPMGFHSALGTTEGWGGAVDLTEDRGKEPRPPMSDFANI